MPEPSDTLHILVEFFDGQDEDDDGNPYYVASCDAVGGVTDGQTWNELMRNIEEMMDAALVGEDTIAAYNVVPNPRLVVTIELPQDYLAMV